MTLTLEQFSFTPTSTDNRGRFLKDITDRLAAIEEREREISVDWYHIWIDTFHWCTEQAHHGDARSISEAVDQLAKRLNRVPMTIWGYFYCGHYILKYNIPEDIHANSLRIFQQRIRTMSKATMLRVLQMIKDRKPHRQVLRAMLRSKEAILRAAERKAEQLIQDKQMTKQRMKMEAMGLNTIMTRFFGEPTHIYVTDEEGNPLIEA